MLYGKIQRQLSKVGEQIMASNPYWFNNQVVYFEDDNRSKYSEEMIPFYDIFVEQLDVKLYEEQLEDALTSTSACFFFKS
ncbi:MAG: hypothetical protein H6536_01060 [Bacteroidales bacterium]|nr:hypothetical protein [Bacteroidales bacterium]